MFIDLRLETGRFKKRKIDVSNYIFYLFLLIKLIQFIYLLNLSQVLSGLIVQNFRIFQCKKYPMFPGQ